MLPFLKNQQEGAISEDDDPVKRKSDGDMDLLDACAQDIMHAIEKKDVSYLKSALESLVAHIQDMDVEQDKEMMDGY